MATPTDVLNRARAEIGAPGSVESPLGSNSGTKYHQWYGNVQGYQWCAIFQSWLFFPMLGYKSYYTGDWIQMGTAKGWMILGPVPAAVCVMDRYPYLEQGGISDHVGVVESVNGSARTMTLIEGNYGDRVARVTRPIDGSTKYYFIFPKFSTATPQEEIELGIASIQKDMIAGEKWETANFDATVRSGRTDVDLINKAAVQATVTIEVRFKSGYKNVAVVVPPISEGSPGMKNYEIGELMGNKEMGNFRLTFTTDQPLIVKVTQELK